MAIRAILAVGLVAVTVAGVAQDVPPAPPAPPPEIVVEGERPRVDTGMWEIHQWPSRSMRTTAGGRRSVSTMRGWDMKSCIADGAIDDAIARLLGSDNRAAPPGCSRLRIRVGDGRLTGNRSCTKLGLNGVIEVDRRYRGTLTPTRLDMRIDTQGTSNGAPMLVTNGRLTAERTGECPGSAPAPSPAPSSRTIPALDPPEVPRDERAAGAPPSPRVPAQAVQESADDIVVVARRLRKLRLRYTSTGRRMYYCRADVSSGDRRVDRIGCAIVRSCVRAGFGETGPDIACFRRKVDSLEPD